eukprot:PITA_15189
MLYDQDLPRFLWEEACNNPMYIHNRIPHRALGKKMPRESSPRRNLRTGREVCQTLKDAKEFIRAPRADKRQRRQPNRYQALVALVAEPSSFQEAAQHQVWVDAMVEEYSSIMTNDVWDVVPRPKDRSVVGSKWIYKIKYATDGSVEKYKPRFMAKGYAQK